MDKRPFPAYRGEEPYVFVSYAHADAEVVYPLLTALHERGVRIWYDEGIEPGSKWREELSGAIRNADKVLFIASKRSVASTNCERELDYALSLGIDVRVVYIEQVELPPALSFSLGSHQAITAGHYDAATFQDKVYDVLIGAPEKRLGRIKTQKRSSSLIALVVAAFVALPLIAYIAFGIDRSPAPQEAAPIDFEITPTIEEPVRIAIQPIKNATGDDTLGWVGDGLANLVRDQLAASRYAVVLSPVSWLSITENATTDAALVEAAKQSGLDYLIAGDLVGEGEELFATIRVTNLRAGIDVMSQSYPDLTTKKLLDAASRIGISVRQALKIPRETELQSVAADFVVDNLAAYEAYVKGVRHFNKFEYEEAEKDLEGALSLSPEFHVARYRLAEILRTTSRVELARSAIAEIPEDASTDTRERLYFDAFRFAVNGQHEKAIETYGEILAAYPYEVEAQQLLARAYYDTYQEDKSIDILQQLRRQEPQNPHVLGALGFQLTSIGKLEEAAEVLKEYVDLYPEVPNSWELNGALKLRQADLSGAEADFLRALEAEPNFNAARIGLARTLAFEGKLNAAAEGFAGIRDDVSLPPRPRIDAAFDLANVLRALSKPEAVDDALEPVRQLITEETVRVGLYWYVKAQAAAERGELTLAREYLANGQRDTPSGGVPTRFLHLIGVLDVAAGQSLDEELASLSEYRLPEDNPDRTEDKAIAHLKGLAALQGGDASAAIKELENATSLYGYEYGVYGIDLARAYFADGKRKRAITLLEKAREPGESLLSGDVRLDLLLDRRRAALIQADFHDEMNEPDKAARIRASLALE